MEPTGEETLVHRLRNGDHLALLGGANGEVLCALSALLEEAADEVARLRAVVIRAAQDLYRAEIHRQGVGWDDYCTDLLVRSQHALAAETKP